MPQTRVPWLSSEAGRVELTWRADGEADGAPALRLVWRERDGPAVAAPFRRGFGRMLLEQGLTHDLGGRVAMDFRPDGLACELTVPLEAAVVPNAAGNGAASGPAAAP